MASPELPAPVKALFRPIPPKAAASPPVDIPVHFNPESLSYTVSNTLRDEGKGAQKKQFVDKTDPKLSMQLVFDSTDTGADVRVATRPLAQLVSPYDDAEKKAKGGKNGKKQVPPNVEFSWGSFSFTGLIESYKEVLDYFSADGVPLRAVIDLTMTGQQPQFAPPAEAGSAADSKARQKTEATVLAAQGGASGLANQLGDPRAARQIAEANGAESLRSIEPKPMAVSDEVPLKKESPFSQAGQALADARKGLSGLPAGGSFSSADLLSGAGSGFAGLRSPVEISVSLGNPQALFGGSESFGLAAGTSARFGVSGISQGGGAGPCTDVGRDSDLAALIRFVDEA